MMNNNKLDHEMTLNSAEIVCSLLFHVKVDYHHRDQCIYLFVSTPTYHPKIHMHIDPAQPP